jgi:hypothetical protein
MTTSIRAVDEYPLTPMQQGMLSQTLAAPGEGVYSIVVSYRLRGPLRPAVFAEAWRRVVAHHPVLRTSFEWLARPQAAQVVHERVALEVVEQDWRGEPGAADRLRAFLEADRRRGFDVSQAPLLRVALIRTADDVYEFVLTHHHLLMDGSCKPLLFGQVFDTYAALCEGRQAALPPARPFREFVDWMRAQRLDDSEAFWRGELRGVTQPTRLWPGQEPAVAPSPDYHEHHARLDEDATGTLRQWARRQRLTLNTLVTGAWALLLASAGQTPDVVFGAIVNARPPDLDGIDSMLGLFIATVPVRVRVEPDAATAAWLRALQAAQADAREHALAPLAAIARWSGVSGGQALFDSVLVFENNAGYGAGPERYGDITIEAVTPVIRNSLPLTLRCVPGAALELHLLYETRRFDRAVIERAGAHLCETLTAVPECGDVPLSSLLARLAALDTSHAERAARAYEASRHDALRSLRRDARRGGGSA